MRPRSHTRHLDRARISANGLFYAHPDGTPLFGELTFALSPGRHGLVGANGIGKSTLLRLVAGELSPSAGSIAIAGSVAYLPQSEPAPDEPLSGGERARSRLAKVFARETDWLLLDEPSNHLDAAGRAWLHAEIERRRGGLLIASHDRALLERVENVVELSSRGLRSYGGPFSRHHRRRSIEDDAAERALAAADAAAQAERLDLIRSRERSAQAASSGKARAIRQNLPKVARGAKKRSAQVAAGKTAATHERRVEEATRRRMAALDAIRDERAIALDLPSSTLHRTKVVVDVAEVSIVGPRRIAVRGENGSGKTTLPRAISAAARVPCAYLDQHLTFLPREISLAAAMRDAAPQLAEHERRAILGRLLFEQERGLQRIGDLSGGERTRAALALVLWNDPPPQLLLLDEPENHLDAASKRHLAQALAGFRGAIFAVSHDDDFPSAIGVESEVTLAR